MKTRQEKIDAIYEKIADKTLSFGCSFLCKYGLDKNYIRRIIIGDLGKEFLTVFPDYPLQIIENHKLFDRVRKNCVLKIIGHPVMIGDVMDWIDDNFHKNLPLGKDREEWRTKNHLLAISWQEKRKPIEEQDDECISFVYSLISE